MKRTMAVSLLIGLLSLGSLAIAGDTQSSRDGCPPECRPSPECCSTSCPMGG